MTPDHITNSIERINRCLNEVGALEGENLEFNDPKVGVLRNRIYNTLVDAFGLGSPQVKQNSKMYLLNKGLSSTNDTDYDRQQHYLNGITDTKIRLESLIQQLEEKLEFLPNNKKQELNDPVANRAKQQLLKLKCEFDELLRSMPSESALFQNTEDGNNWIGRACALIDLWNPVKNKAFELAYKGFFNLEWVASSTHYREMQIIINQARSALQMQTNDSANIAISQGKVFEYFDELRKVIQTATIEILFIDPYLDADFISTYLPQIKSGVSVRLLTSRIKLNSLLPAAKIYKSQNSVPIEIRTSDALHDRYVILDKSFCYQSGASFKDGGRNAPTILTQIIDPFPAVLQTYEAIWNAAAKEIL